jgi:hypothetical protein
MQAVCQISPAYADPVRCRYGDNEKLFYHPHLNYPVPVESVISIVHEFLLYRFEIYG